jgi:hypothetical protein
MYSVVVVTAIRALKPGGRSDQKAWPAISQANNAKELHLLISGSLAVVVMLAYDVRPMALCRRLSAGLPLSDFLTVLVLHELLIQTL